MSTTFGSVLWTFSCQIVSRFFTNLRWANKVFHKGKICKLFLKKGAFYWLVVLTHCYMLNHSEQCPTMTEDTSCTLPKLIMISARPVKERQKAFESWMPHNVLFYNTTGQSNWIWAKCLFFIYLCHFIWLSFKKFIWYQILLPLIMQGWASNSMSTMQSAPRLTHRIQNFTSNGFSMSTKRSSGVS